MQQDKPTLNPPSSSHKCRDHDALRNELILETVIRANEESPFYNELYARFGVDANHIRTVHDLHQLPIVTKEQLRKAGRAALCKADERRVSHIQNTTGTTGEQFFVYRSVAETQFIHDFYSRLNTSEPTTTRLAPIMLQIQFPHHGTSTPVPANIFVVPFSVNDDHLVDYALLVLRKEFDMPGIEKRVSILSGSHTGILILTSYLLEQDIQCNREFNIKLIHLEGRYLTSRWRRVLQETWDAAISDKYSLAEVFGGANWCSICKGYHFDPHIVPELVDFTGEKILDKGTGVLLLTSLYPFVQLQPMIRYWTADVFSLDPHGCHEPRFEFHGRMNHALFNPNDEEQLLLTGVDIAETLDPLPEINRTMRFRDVTRARFGQATGRLLVRGFYARANGVNNFTLKVEVAVPLMLYPDRMQSLRQKVANDLLARSENLSALVSSGKATLNIDFVKPGTLEPLERITTQLWVEQ